MTSALRYPEWALLGLATTLSLVIAGIVSGVGDSAHWLSETAARTRSHDAAKIQTAPSATLQSLSPTWQAPLFSTDRTADRVMAQAQVSSLAGLTLSGILIEGELRVALIKRSDGPPLKIRQGQVLPSGWTLQKLTPMQAEFSFDGRLQTLQLHAPRLPPPSNTPPISLPRESTP